MRTPAPPYVGEGPHALWHVSENPSIKRLEPHVSATAKSPEPRVWAVDTRHLPLYWFPRECPRGTFWATPETSADDARLRVPAPRGLVCARPPGRGYWLSRETVLPTEVVELGDLVVRHEHATIELRALDNLWPTWTRVIASSLEFSGIRLRNAQPLPV